MQRSTITGGDLMPKEKQIKVEIEIPAYLIQRATRNYGQQIKHVLEDELGREVVERAIKEIKK
jgi:hypothetical protein